MSESESVTESSDSLYGLSIKARAVSCNCGLIAELQLDVEKLKAEFEEFKRGSYAYHGREELANPKENVSRR